jgi:WD40 repeat protein
VSESHRGRFCVACGLAVLLAACSSSPTPAATSPAAKPDVIKTEITLAASIGDLKVITGDAIALGLGDGQVAVWNGRDGSPAVVVKPHNARVLAVGGSADHREVWSVAADGTLSRSPLAPGSPIAAGRVDFGQAPVRAAAFATDGTLLVTGDEFGEIRVFDTATAALRHRLRGHRTEIQAIAVRPGSSLVATASAEADLRIWDVAAGREVKLIESDLSLFALGFSPIDGTLAAGGVDRRLTLREPAAFATTGAFTLAAPRLLSTLAWSPDGRFLAVGDVDDETLSKGGIQVIDAATRAVVTTLDTGNEPAGHLVFVNASTIAAATGLRVRSWMIPRSTASAR